MSFIFVFFKQKTAYEMRISDWSSDVCSSDLRRQRHRRGTADRGRHRLLDQLVERLEAERLQHRRGLRLAGADVAAHEVVALLQRGKGRLLVTHGLTPPGAMLSGSFCGSAVDEGIVGGLVNHDRKSAV